MKLNKMELLSSLVMVTSVIIVCRNLIAIMAGMVGVLDSIEEMVNGINSGQKRRYKADHDPNKGLFDQLRAIRSGKFTPGKPTSPRRTAEHVAKAQGRSVIYICPDETTRLENGDIVSYKGSDIPYEFRGHLPVTFTSDETFREWLNEATLNATTRSRDEAR